jgi:hypothetical protein
MMAVMEEELEQAAQALYALPFDAFIAARTAAAKDAAASNKPLAQAIRTLPKPSVAAWTVNMLAHHRPDAVHQLRTLGQTMQEAQASLDAAALRELAKERRKLLGAAVGEARLAAEEQGRKVSGAVATEVEETLRAATADLAAAAAVESGLLLRGLSADGVDQVDLSDAVAVPSALGKLPPPRPLAAVREAPAPAAGAPHPAGGAPKGRRQEPAAPPPPTGRRERTHPSKAAARPDAGAAALKPEKPRLQAVRSAPRPVTPSLLEKAQAALAEAEEAAAQAADEAARRAEAQEEAAAAFVRLTAEVSEARQRLRSLEVELDAARKERETAAAEAKQFARAAEKSERSAVLAKERVLRLRNTPD